MQATDIPDRGDDLRPHQDAADDLVRRRVVRHQPEARRLRARTEERHRRVVPDCLVDAAQVPQCDGSSRPGQAQRRCGCRRELHRRGQTGQTRPWRARQDAGGHRGRARQPARVRPGTDAGAEELRGRHRLAVRPRQRRDGFRGHHRWCEGLRVATGVRVHAQGLQREAVRPEGTRAAPRRAPRRVTGQTLAAGHPPGSRRAGASSELPQRVLLPVQPSAVPDSAACCSFDCWSWRWTPMRRPTRTSRRTFGCATNASARNGGRWQRPAASPVRLDATPGTVRGDATGWNRNPLHHVSPP